MKQRLPFLLIPIVVITLVSIYVTVVTERQRSFTYRFNDYDSIVLPESQEAINHGRHLFVTRGCDFCTTI